MNRAEWVSGSLGRILPPTNRATGEHSSRRRGCDHFRLELPLRVKCGRGSDAPGRSLLPPLTVEVVALTRFPPRAELGLNVGPPAPSRRSNRPATSRT